MDHGPLTIAFVVLDTPTMIRARWRPHRARKFVCRKSQVTIFTSSHLAEDEVK